MADAVSYQLINKTGSQLNLVGTAQFPSNWLPAAPTTIAAGAEPFISNNTNDGQIGVTIVFGYVIEGSALDQFWVVSDMMSDSGPEVAQLAPSGHSIDVNVDGDSEDGFLVTLTYQ
jgi:hypothetical protein